MRKNIKHKVRKYKYASTFTPGGYNTIHYGDSIIYTWSSLDDWVLIHKNNKDYICVKEPDGTLHSHWLVEEL